LNSVSCLLSKISRSSRIRSSCWSAIDLTSKLRSTLASCFSARASSLFVRGDLHALGRCHTTRVVKVSRLRLTREESRSKMRYTSDLLSPGSTDTFDLPLIYVRLRLLSSTEPACLIRAAVSLKLLCQQPKKYHEDISESTNVGNERNNVIDLA
jgi:hypothetical protein